MCQLINFLIFPDILYPINAKEESLIADVWLVATFIASNKVEGTGPLGKAQKVSRIIRLPYLA